MTQIATADRVEPVIADGMRILWDVPIPMDDGAILYADVYLPIAEGRYATVMAMGPYGKGLPFQVAYKDAWEDMVKTCPEAVAGSTNKYQNWEVVDPEIWVPDGYACVRIDSRGAGRSPGKMVNFGKRETRDFYECIEWAAAQDWSNGKIGLNGISYFAMNQWSVASLRPPHLAAVSIWEGMIDYYRDGYRHGGIFSQMPTTWFEKQVAPLQHGVGERGERNPNTGELVSGPDTLDDATLKANRLHPGEETLKRPVTDEYYDERTPDVTQMTVPLLSAGNWGGMGLHPRGNFEGYVNSGSSQKWLQVHGNSHYTPFYSPEGVALQKAFFGKFLKGEETGWDRQPPVQLHIRRPGEHFTIRDEQEWPLARTQWTKFYLDPAGHELAKKPVAGGSITYETSGEGVSFTLPTSDKEREFTGPIAVRLVVSSDTTDADLFVVLRLFAPDGKEVLFVGSNDPAVPIALGWLRASQRKLDPERTLPYRPYHSHDTIEPLTPGEPVTLDIEVLPTSIVVPPDYRLVLNIRGCDYDHGLRGPGTMKGKLQLTGVGPFTHAHPVDRPAEIFGGRNTLHFDKGNEPYILLPVIPDATS